MRTTASALTLAALLACGVARAGDAPKGDAARPAACREADAAVAGARQLLAKADDEGALAAVEAAERSCPEPTAEYYVVNAEALVRLKRWNDAVMRFHEALRLAPANAEAANGLAGVFYLSRRYEQARAVLRNAEGAGATVDAELKRAVEEKLAKPR